MEQHWANSVADETTDVFRKDQLQLQAEEARGGRTGELSPWTGHWVET